MKTSKRNTKAVKVNMVKPAERYTVNTGIGVYQGKIGTFCGYVSGSFYRHKSPQQWVRLQFEDGTVRDYLPGNVTPVQVIDCTPTWSAVLPWCLALIEQNGRSSPGYKKAMEELKRMAEVADKYVTFVKGTESESEEDTGPKRVG